MGILGFDATPGSHATFESLGHVSRVARDFEGARASVLDPPTRLSYAGVLAFGALLGVLQRRRAWPQPSVQHLSSDQLQTSTRNAPLERNGVKVPAVSIVEVERESETLFRNLRKSLESLSDLSLCQKVQRELERVHTHGPPPSSLAAVGEDVVEGADDGGTLPAATPTRQLRTSRSACIAP
eukprot:773174-Rhodomonas_salina.2